MRRRTHASTAKYGRMFAEYLGESRIRFTHERCGHTHVIDYAKRPVHRRMQAGGTKMMASWWSKEKSGCAGLPCRTCGRKKT